METENSKVTKSDWPGWSVPSNEELILLAKILMPHVKILSREIVKIIVEDNNKKMNQWTNAFNKLGIRPDIYLWENSPVTFPGIRRHSGKDDIKLFGERNSEKKINNALILDDNSYPKQLWSFALRNKRYSQTNPKNYSLAHIIDHKDYKTRNPEELIGYTKSHEKHLYSGLYTSCVNTIWVPNTLLKPTDHNKKLRLLLIQFIDYYYGDICSILPHKLSFNFENIDKEWLFHEFPKPTEEGNADKINDFLVFRNKIIDDLISNRF